MKPPRNCHDSKSYMGLTKYFIFTLIFCFLYFSSELLFGQKKSKNTPNQETNAKKTASPTAKITICHKGKTIEVSESALKAHLNHGDDIGPCFAGDLNGKISPYYSLPEVKVEEEIGAELTSLVKKFTELGSVPSDDIYVVSGEKVLIEIIGKDISSISTIQDYISLNYPDAILYPDYENEEDLIITVLFPINNLNDLNADLNLGSDVVGFARPVYKPILKSGIVTSQGDKAIQSENARKAFGVDGSDVKICVMSDSYDAKQKAQKDIDNGDLPANIDVSEDYSSDFGSHFNVVDEGRAMLQIAHDVAPGAELGFRTGFVSIEHMAEGINILQSEGCDLIVDDITHLSEPFFTDGLISNAVDKVSNDGVIYFSSAGNAADWGFESQFSPTVGNETYHDFGVVDGTRQQVRFREAGTYIIVFQWDDVYKSLGGIGNNGANNDFDISLLDADGNTLVALHNNNLGGDPIEVMPIRVEEAGALANIVIKRASGTENVNFKYIVFVGGYFFDILHEQSSVSTIVGQANAAGAYAVGAASYTKTPAYNVNPPIIEPFSSYGGTLINNIDREKPDFVAPDNANTSVFSVGLDNDGDLFPNFPGTSAAAPHAAAVAALIIDAQKKFEVPEFDVGEKMKETALKINPSGYDRIFGGGYVLADSAIGSFAAPKPSITELVVPDNLTTEFTDFEITVIGENMTGNSIVKLDGTPIADEDITFVNSTAITATIAVITSESNIQIETPPITPSGDDGGSSNSFSLFSVRKKIITVAGNSASKKFGEVNPDFTSTILVDDLPLAESDLSEEEISRLSALSFAYETSANSWGDPVGIYYIRPMAVETEDETIFEEYDFTYADGFLTIEKMPMTIKPIIEGDFYYGDKIEGVSFDFDLYSDGADNNENINDIEQLLQYIEQEYKSTFPDNSTNAIVDRARLLVNRARLLVNEFGWLVTESALSNRARLLVNGNTLIDVDIDLLNDYQSNPDGTLSDRARLLVNGQSLFNGDAGLRDELGNRARLLVNEGGLGSSESEGEDFSNITVIIDSLDNVISKLFSINLISGLEVNQPGEAPHYFVPGAFISPAAINFITTTEDVEYNILPVPLDIQVDNKNMVQDDPFPEFTSSFTGFKLDDDANSVFSEISYTLAEIDELHSEINVTYELNDPANYTIDPISILPGILTTWERINGKIAYVSNRDEDYEIYTMNSDGSNQKRLTYNDAIDADPAWNPFGTLIAYREQSTSSIAIMDPNGVKIRNISSGDPTRPAWSNDGTKIVFGKNADIYVINQDGSNETQLTSGEQNDGFPDFSPDGTRIVFERDNNIWIMNSDGTGAEAFYEHSNSLTHPKYSPDGSKIVFNYGSDIAMINIDGSGFNQLNDPIQVASDVFPDWSPLGDRLTWHVFDGNNDIWTINPDASEKAQLTANDWSETDPDWSIAPDDVYIPDPNFEQALVDLGIDSDGIINQQILTSDAQVVTELNISDPENNENLPNVYGKISDLTGIEAFINLTHLEVQYNQLTNLEVSQNIALTELFCWDNQLSILDVSQNTALAVLNCDLNQLTDLDLSNNRVLSVVSCSDNNLTDLDVSQSTSLTELYCVSNQLTSLDLFQSAGLFRLNCDLNQIAELDLSQNNALGELWCANNQMTRLDIRNGNNVNLSILYAVNNNLSCINVDDEGADYPVWEVDEGVSFSNDCGAPIFIPDGNFEQALIDLGIDSDGIINQQILVGDALSTTSLDISDPENNVSLPNVNTKISDLTGIEAFGNLTYLNCSQNLLTNLDMTKNTDLNTLFCEANQLATLNVTQNTGLAVLYCEDNQLTELDVSNNVALVALSCPHNLLTSLVVSQNTALDHLQCGSNNLTELNLTQNTSLTGLFCDFNQLTSLDVSQNTSLTGFSCYGNLITSLDVSGNTALTQVNFGSNQLTALNVSQNTALTVLGCAYNQLTSLIVTNNPALTILHCDNNSLTQLDLRNGNNGILNELFATNNNLSCINVDDENAEYNWEVDEGVSFSNDCGNAGYSGTRTITGTVTADGLPFPGINITIKGTTTGTITGNNGEYSLFISGNDDVLVVSFTGFGTVEETVGDRIVVDISIGESPEGFSSSRIQSSSIVQGDMTIYPNPVVDVITISHQDESILISDMGVVVYDSYGVIYPTRSNLIETAEGFELDLSSLVPKNYILHISDGKTLEMFRIQKE